MLMVHSSLPPFRIKLLYNNSIILATKKSKMYENIFAFYFLVFYPTIKSKSQVAITNFPLISSKEKLISF